LYVPLPTPHDRVSILKALSSEIKLAADVNLETIGHHRRAEGYSGADCAALLREAGLAVLKESMGSSRSDDADNTKLEITARHFEYAFDHVLPSVSKKDQARYDKMRDKMARARTRVGVLTDETVPIEETPIKQEPAAAVAPEAKS
jgi:ribosome biogenesis ATPase